MAAKKYFVDIDLQKNKLVNVVLENTTPSAAGGQNAGTGRIIFDSEEKVLKYYDGVAWQSSETRLDGALQYKGSIAFNGTPTASQTGDLYVFSKSGTTLIASFGAEKLVEAGDFAIKNADGTWDIIQGNVVDATTSVKGAVTLASDSDTTTGTDAAKAITASNLTAWANQANKTLLRKQVITGVEIKTTQTEVPHSIGTDNPYVMVYDSAGNEIEVLIELGTGSVKLTSNSIINNATVIVMA